METKSDLAQQLEKTLIDKDAAIEVLDNNGVITLTGTVDDAETRDRAGEIVGKHAGVISVTNDLVVDERSDELSGIPPIAPTSHISQ